LPPAPISPRTGAASVWTGQEWIVWGRFDDVADGHQHAVADGAAYDPATRTWNRIPPPVETSGRRITSSEAVATDHNVLAWAEWQVGSRKAAGHGSDLFSYDPQTNLWTYLLPTTDALSKVSGAVWTGHEVFAAGTCKLGADRSAPSGLPGRRATACLRRQGDPVLVPAPGRGPGLRRRRAHLHSALRNRDSPRWMIALVLQSP
jgi:hypothetical protein